MNRAVRSTTGPYQERHWVSHGLPYRHALWIGLAFGGTLFFVALPMLLLTLENYRVFNQISQSLDPSVARALQREVSWFKTLYVVGTVMGFVIGSWVGFRLTSRVVWPIRIVEAHMMSLMKGIWNQPDVRVRKTDELKGFVGIYNYFFRFLRAQSEFELKMLEKLEIAPSSIDLWSELIRRKRSQLRPDADDADEKKSQTLLRAS